MLTELICETFFYLEKKFTNEEELNHVLNDLKSGFANILMEYEVKMMCTQLIVYQPWENYLKMYSVSKYIEGMSKGTIYIYLRAYLYKCEIHKRNSKRTVDHKRTIISSFFEWMLQEEYINVNPARKIKPIKYEEKLKQPLTQFNSI